MLIGVMAGATSLWILAAMASITSISTGTGRDVLRTRLAAWLPRRMAPVMWVAHRPGTETRGVQGTAMVGERARTMAFPIWGGGPPPELRQGCCGGRGPGAQPFHVASGRLFPHPEEAADLQDKGCGLGHALPGGRMLQGGADETGIRARDHRSGGGRRT